MAEGFLTGLTAGLQGFYQGKKDGQDYALKRRAADEQSIRTQLLEKQFESQYGPEALAQRKEAQEFEKRAAEQTLALKQAAEQRAQAEFERRSRLEERGLLKGDQELELRALAAGLDPVQGAKFFKRQEIPAGLLEGNQAGLLGQSKTKSEEKFEEIQTQEAAKILSVAPRLKSGIGEVIDQIGQRQKINAAEAAEAELMYVNALQILNPGISEKAAQDQASKIFKDGFFGRDTQKIKQALESVNRKLEQTTGGAKDQMGLLRRSGSLRPPVDTPEGQTRLQNLLKELGQ
jgi:hypothetical protein